MSSAQAAFAAAWQQAQQALQRGDAAAALAPLRHCLQLQPQHAGLWLQTAVSAFQCGQSVLARQLLESALQRWPEDVALLFHLGYLLELGNDAAAAEDLYRRTLAVQPGHADTLRNLASLLARDGRAVQAWPLMRQLLQLQPQDVELRAAAAGHALQAGETATAQQLARQVLAQQPQHVAALRALGAASRERRDLDCALPALQQAVAQAPQDAALLADLGQAHIEAADFDTGRALLRRAVTLDPQHRLIDWIGALALPALVESEAMIDRVCADFAAQLERIHAELRLDTPARIEAACASISRVLPFPLHYLPRDNRAIGRRFGELVQRVMQAAGGELAQPPATRRHDGRLRVGFVSAELREHTITRYFSRWLEELDPAHFERWAWHCGFVADAMTARLAHKVEHFAHVRLPPLQLAAQIRAAALDVVVLLDVGMDPQMHALAALALAPRQYLAYGHPVSSGMSSLSGFLSGAALEIPQADAHYIEPLLRLPGLGALPARPGPAVAATPRRGGTPQFLCIQNLAKVTPSFDTTLARIARESGGCISFFAGSQGAQPLDRRFLERVSAAFRAQGVDPQQHLQLRQRNDYADYLQALADADAILDTPWFSGGATSLDTCHVGAPVVTWPGAFMRSRQTAGMLQLLDLPQTIAADEDDYIAKVLDLLARPAATAELREQLRLRAPRLFEANGGLAALAAVLQNGTLTS